MCKQSKTTVAEGLRFRFEIKLNGNLAYDINHLLDETESNVRFALLGQVMLSKRS